MTAFRELNEIDITAITFPPYSRKIKPISCEIICTVQIISSTNLSTKNICHKFWSKNFALILCILNTIIG